MATSTRVSRRTLLGSSVLGGLALAAGFRPAHAADKVTFLTSWYAQAEHGGFYQAKATGMYDKAGIDATIKMGGPQVNAIQLLLAGEVDIIMGYDIQCLKALEQGLPVITVGTSFQYDLQGMLTHDNVGSLADLKDKTILVATSGRTTWWPWLKKKYGYTDEQTKAYTFNLQPFFADKNTVQQGYPSSEPFQADAAGHPAQVLPVRRRRLSALRHHAGDDPALPRRQSRPHAALRARHPRRLEGLHRQSGPGECADQGSQSEDVGCADRLRHREDEGAEGARRRRRGHQGASAPSRKSAGRRPTSTWSMPAS